MNTPDDSRNRKRAHHRPADYVSHRHAHEPDESATRRAAREAVEAEAAILRALPLAERVKVTELKVELAQLQLKCCELEEEIAMRKLCRPLDEEEEAA